MSRGKSEVYQQALNRDRRPWPVRLPFESKFGQVGSVGQDMDPNSEDWNRMTEEERCAYVGVPPPGYFEEDQADTLHPGHPINFG